jgi:hypothetical protein
MDNMDLNKRILSGIKDRLLETYTISWNVNDSNCFNFVYYELINDTLLELGVEIGKTIYEN